jgi:hypothetical protein
MVDSMTTLYRIRTVWSSFPGAPGYTNLYFGTTDPLLAGATLAAASVRSFWQSLNGMIPNGASLLVESAVALIEDFSGEQTGELAVSPAPAVVTGTSTGAYTAPSGAVITWGTGAYRFGRKVKGRTYIVPLGAGSYDATGTLEATHQSGLQSAANALIATGAHLVVYSRPRAAKAAERIDGSDAVAARVGASTGVTSAVVADRAAVLRSRRD